MSGNGGNISNAFVCGCTLLGTASGNTAGAGGANNKRPEKVRLMATNMVKMNAQADTWTQREQRKVEGIIDALGRSVAGLAELMGHPKRDWVVDQLRCWDGGSWTLQLIQGPNKLTVEYDADAGALNVS